MADLSGRGLFEVTMGTYGGGTERRLFARNPPVEEGHLQKMTAGGFIASYPSDLAGRVTIIEPESGAAANLAGEGELWRFLGIAMLGSLLLESILAWRFGRR